MTLRLQIIIGCIIVFLFLFIMNMVRKKKVDLRYVISWLVILVVILMLDVFPQMLIQLADLFGIATPSNMVFFVGFLLVFILLYTATLTISKLSIKLERISQEVAILQNELEKAKKQMGGN